jgi:hypothetical protein
VSNLKENQIPCGNDKKKSRGNSKSNGNCKSTGNDKSNGICKAMTTGELFVPNLFL